MTTRNLSVCIGGMSVRLGLPDSRLAGELRRLLAARPAGSLSANINLKFMIPQLLGGAKHMRLGETRLRPETPAWHAPRPTKFARIHQGRANRCYSAKSAKASFATKHEPGEPRPVTEEILHIDGCGEYTAVFDMKKRVGQAGLSPTGERRADIVLNCLRQICARVIIEEGGLVLHAACIVRTGRAFVFVGQSGAGKTTVCTLSPHCRIATDDTTVVRRLDGKFVAWGMPGTGSFQPPADSGPFEVAAVFKLVQDKRVRLVPMSGAKATAGILALPFFSSEGEIVGKMLELVRDLTDHVPCYELHFRKDPSFWKCIDREMGKES